MLNFNEISFLKNKKIRKNGWVCPFNWLQIFWYLMYVIDLIIFLIFILPSFLKNKILLFCSIYSFGFFYVISFMFWLLCSISDPSD